MPGRDLTKLLPSVASYHSVIGLSSLVLVYGWSSGYYSTNHFPWFSSGQWTGKCSIFISHHLSPLQLSHIGFPSVVHAWQALRLGGVWTCRVKKIHKKYPWFSQDRFHMVWGVYSEWVTLFWSETERNVNIFDIFTIFRFTSWTSKLWCPALSIPIHFNTCESVWLQNYNFNGDL